MIETGRREFLGTLAIAVGGIALGPGGCQRSAKAQQPSAGAPRPRIRKSIRLGMIRENLSALDKFKLLKDLGFDGIEVRAQGQERAQRRDLKRASESTGVDVHGVIGDGDSDLEKTLALASYYNATSVRVVAGRVNKETPYDRNYADTQAAFRKVLPYAESLDVRILVENVPNYFLLSPLEMARYIDELDSPAAGVCFNIGHAVRIGWPEQWIRILGGRIINLAVADNNFQRENEDVTGSGSPVLLGEGDCDWPAVRQALADIGFTSGWASADVRGGNRQRLKDIAQRMDKVLDLGR